MCHGYYGALVTVVSVFFEPFVYVEFARLIIFVWPCYAALGLYITRRWLLYRQPRVTCESKTFNNVSDAEKIVFFDDSSSQKVCVLHNNRRSL